jgi:hypothetical protein
LLPLLQRGRLVCVGLLNQQFIPGLLCCHCAAVNRCLRLLLQLQLGARLLDRPLNVSLLSICRAVINSCLWLRWQLLFQGRLLDQYLRLTLVDGSCYTAVNSTCWQLLLLLLLRWWKLLLPLLHLAPPGRCHSLPPASWLPPLCVQHWK